MWLLSWINLKLEAQEMTINNFVRDWNDGIALGALVNVLAPGSCLHSTRLHSSPFPFSHAYACLQCPIVQYYSEMKYWAVHSRIACCNDWRRWDPEESLQNVTKAMAAADQWLEIPQVLYTVLYRCTVIVLVPCVLDFCTEYDTIISGILI